MPELRNRKITLANAVSEAFSEISSLAEEVREAYDNTPESLQGSAVGEARDQAASDLENISEPDVPPSLCDDEFSFEHGEIAYTPKQLMKLSRSARRDNAVALWQSSMDYLQELLDKYEGVVGKEELRGEIKNLMTEIETAKDEAEAVEFPGRNG